MLIVYKVIYSFVSHFVYLIPFFPKGHSFFSISIEKIAILEL